MTQPQARFGIAITADDRTAKGVKAAERRLGQIPRHAAAVNGRYASEAERTIGRSSRSILRTFGAVEQAGARALGGRSLTSGITSRLGAVREAASAAGSGMGEAATAGGVLSTAMTGVGVVAGATIGILAAAGYAAFKLATGWAQGAASIGRTAATIGIATKALQEFNAAAERQGVDRATSTGALDSLTQTLNDARYGRNNDAVALLGRLGVHMQTNKDGTADTATMLPQIADALARQNSSGRRTAARILGIPLSALPAFTQGGAALSADMRDADKTAYIASDEDVATGQRIGRKGAIVGQMKDRVLGMAGAATAGPTEAGYDAVISGATSALDGATSFGGVVRNTFTPAAQKIERGGAAIERAAVVFSGKIGAGLTSTTIAAAQAAQRKWGIPASVQLAQYGVESSWGRHMPAGSNNPFGIKARKGEASVMAMTTEIGRDGRPYRTTQPFRKFGSQEEAFDAHAKLLARGRYTAKFRAALPNVERAVDELGGGTSADPRYAGDRNYGVKLRAIMRQKGLRRYDAPSAPIAPPPARPPVANTAKHTATFREMMSTWMPSIHQRETPAPIPVKVEVHLKNAPPGTRATVTAGRRNPPAVSHAMEH